jgi:hypothetical protein
MLRLSTPSPRIPLASPDARAERNWPVDAGSWRLSSSGEKEGNVTLRDATSTSIIATTLAGLLFTGGALPALAEERMSEEQMMQQFGECIRNTCEVRVGRATAVPRAAAHSSRC